MIHCYCKHKNNYFCQENVLFAKMQHFSGEIDRNFAAYSLDKSVCTSLIKINKKVLI